VGLIEGLSDELRPFHLKVSLVEPAVFHTNFDARPPASPLAAYVSARQSMMQFVHEAVEQGPDPEHVARRIAQLAISAGFQPDDREDASLARDGLQQHNCQKISSLMSKFTLSIWTVAHKPCAADSIVSRQKEEKGWGTGPNPGGPDD